MLRGIFTFPLRVRDFVISTYDIPPESRALLGNPTTTTLGVNLQIGHTYVSMTHRFEIRVGPVTFDEYQSLMSGMSGFELLTQVVNLYLDRPLDYNVLFKLKSSTIPGARLGFDWENGGDAAQLGYSCWLGNAGGDETSLVIDASRLCRRWHKENMSKKRSNEHG
jgi:predicted component of type VI protein secretion system